MSALSDFDRTLKRASNLVQIHKALNPRGKPKGSDADILRAAVVVAVSAMDAYIHDTIVERVAKFIRAKKGRALPGKFIELVKGGTSSERLIEIIFEERPLAHMSTMVKKAIADRTFQNAGKIESGLKILGVTDLWMLMGRRLRVKKDKAKTYVQKYVDRRHAIVHRGDVGTAKRTKGKIQKMSRPYASSCVTDISRFVHVMDAILNAKVPQR